MHKALLWILIILSLPSHSCTRATHASAQSVAFSELAGRSYLSLREMAYGKNEMLRPRGVWVDLDADGQSELVVAGIRARAVRDPNQAEEEGFIAVFRCGASGCARTWDMTFDAMLIGNESKRKLTVHQIRGRNVVFVPGTANIGGPGVTAHE